MSNRLTNMRGAALAMKRVTQCVTCKIDKEAKEFVREMRARVPPVSFSAIAAGLAAGGVKLSGEQIATHERRGHER